MNDCYYCGAGGATDWRVFDTVIDSTVFVCDDCHDLFTDVLSTTDSYEKATAAVRDSL